MSILKFDLEEVSTLIGPSGPHSKLIFLDDMVYDSWMGL